MSRVLALHTVACVQEGGKQSQSLGPWKAASRGGLFLPSCRSNSPATAASSQHCHEFIRPQAEMGMQGPFAHIQPEPC